MRPFKLTVVNGTGTGRYKPGRTVAITANPAPTGKSFEVWTGFAVAAPSSASTSLIMPSREVTVTATYKATVTPPPPPPPPPPPVTPPTIYSQPWPPDADGLQNARGIILRDGEPWAVIKAGFRSVEIVNMITGASLNTDPQVVAPPGPTLPGGGGAHVLADGRVVICWHEQLGIFNPDWTLARKIVLPYRPTHRKPVTSGAIIGNELFLVRDPARSTTCSWTSVAIAVDLDTGAIREGAPAVCTATVGCLAGLGEGGWADLVRTATGLYVFGNATDGSGQMFYAKIDSATLSLAPKMVWQNVNYHGPMALPVTDGTQVACPCTTSSGIPAVVLTTDFVGKRLIAATDWQQPTFGILPDIRVAFTAGGTLLLTLHGSSRLTGQTADYLLYYDGAKFQQLDAVPFVSTAKPYPSALTVHAGKIYWLGPGGATAEPLRLRVYEEPQ